MITECIRGPVGGGVVYHTVAQRVTPEEAAEILVISYAQLFERWRQLLPGAKLTTAHRWLKSPPAGVKLIIVDELHLAAFNKLLEPLQKTEVEVWLISPPGPQEASTLG